MQQARVYTENSRIYTGKHCASMKQFTSFMQKGSVFKRGTSARQRRQVFKRGSDAFPQNMFVSQRNMCVFLRKLSVTFLLYTEARFLCRSCVFLRRSQRCSLWATLVFSQKISIIQISIAVLARQKYPRQKTKIVKCLYGVEKTENSIEMPRSIEIYHG